MERYLLIAEKPSLMNEIKNVYDNNRSSIPFQIDFAFQAGHVVTLKLPSEIDEKQKKWAYENLPFNPEDYGGWAYKVIPGKEALFKELKEKITKGGYDGIIHAGDPDQEGQLLCNLLLQEAKNKLPVKRFWTNDLTDGAILNALLNLRDNDHDEFLINLGKAGLARQHSDYRVGMNFSEAVSLKMAIRAAVGRVKSIVVKIVVDRERAIRNFKPVTTYGLKANYKEKFFGVLFDDDGDVNFKTKEEAEDFEKTLGTTFKVISYDKKREKKYAPPLFKLATLQIEAGKAGYNADKVLAIAQSLYEKKYLSYPRTSCEYLASTLDFDKLLKSCAAFDDLEPFVSKITKDDISRIKKDKKYIDDSKLKEEGHYALSPTTKKPDLSKLSKDELFILNLVFKQFVAIFLPPLIQDKTTIITQNVDAKFKSNGKVLVDKGYTELLTSKSEDNELPLLKEGDIVNLDNFETIERTTTCPKRFTDGDLIAIMENPAKYLDDETLKDTLKACKGIGTPATRAGIIDTLIKVDKYIERKKGKGKGEQIFATMLGEELIDSIGHMDFCSIDITAIWEDKLNGIRIGETSFEAFEIEMMDYVRNTVELIKNDEQIKRVSSGGSSSSVKVIGKCPCCGNDFMMSSKYYYCSNYSKDGNGCKLIFKNEVLGKSLTEKEAIKIITTGMSSKMKFKNPNTKKTFETELVLNKEEFKLDFNFKKASNTVIGECPCCGKNVLDRGTFVSCEGYQGKTCDFAISKNIKGAEITDDDIQNILNGKETQEKKFSSGNAKLFYDKETKKLKFIGSSKSLGTCPKCGKDVLDRGSFACCDAYKKGCDFSISYAIKGAKLTEKDIKTILEGKQTDFKKFTFGNAKISYNKELGKLDWEFEKKKK